jgi:carboxylate-amine ligase
VSTPFRERAPDLDRHDPAALAEAARVAAADVTFGDGPFVLDPVPRVISADDWTAVEAGLLQRVRALDAFCADVYGSRRIVRDGVVPARVVETIDTLEPEMCGTSLDRWVSIAGLDLVRAPDGRFLVLEDNLRTPSGMAYAVAARVMSMVLFEPEHPPLPVDGLRDMLRMALGPGRAALLTDGPSNAAYWEHRWLAELLEIPLVEVDGLDVSGFDVVYRRTNAWQLDSDVGRLLHGRVRVVNAYGVGVGDDKLAHAYVDDMVRYYLGEDPRLGSVRTYDLGRPEVAEEALDRIEELVIKPRAGYGGEGVVIAPHASREDVERTREAVRAAPEDYIAQELIPLSEHATVIDGSVVFRHVDLRPFVFLGAGDEGAVYPGGLTRVALDEGALVVNSSQNGGAKDTWVV